MTPGFGACSHASTASASPPEDAEAQWEPYSAAWTRGYAKAHFLGQQPNPTVVALNGMFVAYRKGDAAAFNRELASYETWLAEHKPADHDLVLLSGVGSVWPMLRAHSLLNCLHTVMGKTPLVMFYPGSFDGTTLRLFGQITTAKSKPGTKPYYRAFTLVPHGKEP